MYNKQYGQDNSTEKNNIITYIKNGSGKPIDIFKDDGEIQKLVKNSNITSTQIRKIYGELLKKYEETFSASFSAAEERNKFMDEINTDFSIFIYRVYYQSKRFKSNKLLFEIVSESIKDLINEKDMEKWKNKIERLKLVFEAIIAYTT